MKLFNFFKNKKNEDLEQLSQEEFDAAVSVLTKYATELEAEIVIKEMTKVGISEKKAVELYLFIPVAFCRQFIPKAAYQNYYVNYYEPHKEIKQKYEDNKLYVAIEKATKVYFAANPQRETVLNLCLVNAEFKAINTALLDGNKLEDLEFAPSYITR